MTTPQSATSKALERSDYEHPDNVAEPWQASVDLEPLGFQDYDGALTPDALLIYVSTRLDGLEDQINQIFSQQQRADKIRSLVNEIKTAVNGLEGGENGENLEGAQPVVDLIEVKLEQLRELDPKLAARMEEVLYSDGYIAHGGEDGNGDTYAASQIEPTLQYLDNVVADLNSASQINMIKLQSLVRSHETAVSLGTNLVEAAGRTTQKIADRIGG